MINSVITIILTFFATSIDEIPILYLLYRKATAKGAGRTITITYITGSLLLAILSILGALGLVQITVPWIVGLIGLLPIGMGLKTLLFGDDDDDAIISDNHSKALWLQVFMITMAFGVDDLGIYIPLFTTLKLFGYAIIIAVIVIGALLLCLLSYRLTAINQLSRFIQKRERLIEGMVFIIIGIYVMIDRGTIIRIIHYFN